jgi:hypothetical protein
MRAVLHSKPLFPSFGLIMTVAAVALPVVEAIE